MPVQNCPHDSFTHYLLHLALAKSHSFLNCELVQIINIKPLQLRSVQRVPAFTEYHLKDKQAYKSCKNNFLAMIGEGGEPMQILGMIFLAKKALKR